MRKNKLARLSPLAALLLAFSLLLGAAGCSSTPGNIGVGLPSVDPTTGAYLIDTLTLRASTVLRDSVITSTSQYLLAGRYVDPQLGTITARSYTTLGLNGAFVPDRSQIADSLVLVVKPDTYRYGDTTKTQTLLEVHELNSFIPTTSYGFAAPRLTPMASRVQATVLNQPVPTSRRARANIGTLRLRLDMKTYGQRLMTDAQNGLLTTQDQLDTSYPGLALLPGASDAAALLRFDATSTDVGLILYYHDPGDVTTALSHTFTFNRHLYQAEAARSGALATLAPSTQQLSAAATGQQTYIEGLLGLETKIEIPYLFDLRNYGQHFIITNATMIAEVPSTTLSTNYPPPANLSVLTTDLNNRQVATILSSTPYSTSISSVDGISQAGYSWSMLSYLQNALNNTIPNYGILLNTATPTQPDRVILGGPLRPTNRLKLRVYLIRND